MKLKIECSKHGKQNQSANGELNVQNTENKNTYFPNLSLEIN